MTIEKELLLKDIKTKGWCYQKNVFDLNLVKNINHYFSTKSLDNALIGNKKLNSEIRSDKIYWIDPKENSHDVQQYFTVIEDIKQTLNENYYLGLSDFESHFARYDAGSFYKPHKDVLKQNNKRVVTVITYFNENWTSQDGGQLRLHLDEKMDIEPVAGSMICFMSDEILHEVLPCTSPRQAITGWLLKTHQDS